MHNGHFSVFSHKNPLGLTLDKSKINAMWTGNPDEFYPCNYSSFSGILHVLLLPLCIRQTLFIQSDLHGIYILSVLAFPENRTHDLAITLPRSVTPF